MGYRIWVFGHGIKQFTPDGTHPKSRNTRSMGSPRNTRTRTLLQRRACRYSEDVNPFSRNAEFARDTVLYLCPVLRAAGSLYVVPSEREICVHRVLHEVQAELHVHRIYFVHPCNFQRLLAPTCSDNMLTCERGSNMNCCPGVVDHHHDQIQSDLPLRPGEERDEERLTSWMLVRLATFDFPLPAESAPQWATAPS